MSRKSISLLFLNIFTIIINSLTEKTDLRVCIPSLGCLQGTYLSGFQIEKFEAFMGIPYAKPPVGKLRLQNPEPFGAWENVIQATKPKPSCLQKNYFLETHPIMGVEDCLYLNLYRPVQRSTKLLPIIFYIHGGGFSFGSPHPHMLGPAYFMDTEEVILITFAYRLGPFGFLSTGDEYMPGNFGLKDQNLALKWVFDNAVHFSGDSNSITIFGHSIGGSSVQFHMLSPASQGLFKRAIMMSGTAIAPFAATLKEPRLQANIISAAVGITDSELLSSEELLNTLQNVDALSLLNASDVLKFWRHYNLINYRTVIEHSSWSNAFLVCEPDTLLKSGNITQVPMMLGMVPSGGEGNIFAMRLLESADLRKEFNANFENMLTNVMEFPKEISNKYVREKMNLIIDEYFQGKRELNNDTLKGFVELLGDISFLYPYYKTIEYYVKQSNINKNPLYLYIFNYQGPYTYTTGYSSNTITDIGVSHLDDMIYLFKASDLFPKGFEKKSIDAELVQEFTKLFVEFAKYGKSTAYNQVQECNDENFYKQGETGICNYLEYRNDGKKFKAVIQQDFNVKRMKFWDNIWNKST